jgi:hypothetical protein
MITSAEPPETHTALYCPGCGLQPTVGMMRHCPDCFDPNDDASELECLRGFTTASWNDAVVEYLAGKTSAQLRDTVASLDARIDAGNDERKHRALAYMLRTELTRRHINCEDTIPPPPSVPREERETRRPGRA